MLAIALCGSLEIQLCEVVLKSVKALDSSATLCSLWEPTVTSCWASLPAVCPMNVPPAAASSVREPCWKRDDPLQGLPVGNAM